MTLLQGLKLYPEGGRIELLISTCVPMAIKGRDVCLLSNSYGFPQFDEKVRKRLPDGFIGCEHRGRLALVTVPMSEKSWVSSSTDGSRSASGTDTPS